MKFDIVKELGRGGFGTVELAKGEDGKEYALKTLNLAAFPKSEHQTLMRRFEREVRYQEQIEHPNVVPIVARNLGDSPPWFVMPLAIGNLADDIQQDHTLGNAPQKALFDILAGLEALHEKGFYHRDLKPANVLKFELEDGSVGYKLSDFGLTTPGAGQTSTLTGSNMGGGTVMYRPPECANNFRRAMAAADIYSFGAILHDIFGGGLPRIPHSKLTVAGPIGPIVEKCTEANPRRRYRSVSSLREALFDVLEGDDIDFYSKEEEDVVNIIRSNATLDDDQWDRIFNIIDDNADKGVSNSNLLRAITRDQISDLANSSPDMFHGLGEIYADFAAKGAFPFEYCDIISDKAQIFFDHGDLRLKSLIALAMLELGTSHNRWLVEWQFLRMAGTDVSAPLANRIKIELGVQNVPFVRRVEHLEASIGAKRSRLHPILQEYLAELEA